MSNPCDLALIAFAVLRDVLGGPPERVSEDVELVHRADVLGCEFDVRDLVDVVLVDVLVPVGVLGAPDGNVCFLREAALIYSRAGASCASWHPWRAACHRGEGGRPPDR